MTTPVPPPPLESAGWHAEWQKGTRGWSRLSTRSVMSSAGFNVRGAQTLLQSMGGYPLHLNSGVVWVPDFGPGALIVTWRKAPGRVKFSQRNVILGTV